MTIEIRTPDFVPEFLFFWDARIFQKKVVWTSFGITKSLTAGNLKILVKNSQTPKTVPKTKIRRQNRQNRHSNRQNSSF